MLAWISHWRQSTICVLDHRGQKLLSKTIKGPWSKVLEVVGKVRKPFAVCFEASTGYGYLFEHSPVRSPAEWWSLIPASCG